MRLTCTRGEERLSFPLPEGETILGRDDGCGICIPDGSLSKRHARLTRRGRRVSVQDLGSRNGTVVDGVPLTGDERRRILPGVRLECGKVALELLAARPEHRLVLLEDGAVSSVWDLIDQPLGLGSLPENEVVLGGEGVSRQHARLVPEAGGWVVEDLGSRNGVLVEGERVSRHRLEPGQRLQIGRAQLRFEPIPPDPLRSLRELLEERAPEDGPALRAALAGVGLLLVLVVALWLGSPPPPPPDEGPALAWLGRVTDHLVAGDLMEARHELRRSQGEVQREHLPIQRALEPLLLQLTRVDRKHERWYLELAWDELRPLTAAASDLPGMPDRTRQWLHQTGEWVGRHAAAYDRLREAQELARRGLEALGAEPSQQLPLLALRQALRSWNGALEIADSLDPSTPMAEEGRALATTLRAQVYQVLRQQLDLRLALRDPPWEECLELIGTARGFTANAQQRVELRALEEDCARNQQDEARYLDAVEVATKRRTDRYQQAILLLEKIDPRSRIHPDAQGWLAWIQADKRVREAEQAWRRGEVEYACTLLLEVTRNESRLIGSETIMEVQQKLERWRSVSQAWERAREQDRAGRTSEARATLELILLREPDPTNWYHRQAEAQLEHMAARRQAELDSRLTGGKTALDKRQFDLALRLFREARDDPHCERSQLARIGGWVQEAKRASNMVQSARQQFGTGGTNTDLAYRLALLVEFLPRNDPDRPELEKLFPRVVEELNRGRAR